MDLLNEKNKLKMKMFYQNPQMMNLNYQIMYQNQGIINHNPQIGNFIDIQKTKRKRIY
jgi:hypothetical protein